MRAISRPTHGIRVRPSQSPPQMCLRVALPMGLAILLAVTVSDDARPQVAGPPDPQSATAEDINRDFLDPALDPDAWVAKLEIESREVFTARKEIIAALRLEPGDRIADIGSGTGLYLQPFSERVGPDGRVYAVDISSRLVEFIERRVRKEGLGNVATVLSTADSTRLVPGSVTHAFVCDAYHHFVEYPAMLASIYEALRPGGQLVVVDFDRVPGKSREWLLSHVRAGKDAVRGEIEEAGFVFVEEIEVEQFNENYLLRFRRP
jgi:cyclopropane fatty-acyl-phospholipid synthase-like methyltransferase